MMTEIDLDGPSVTTTATSVGTTPTGKPTKSGNTTYADEVDLSETFNDEEEEDNIYDEEEGDGIFKVTKRRLSGGSDDGHSLRAKAACWTFGAMVMSLLVIGAIVGVSALLSSSSSSSTKSKNPHGNRVSNEQAERDAELPSWYGNTTTSVSSDAAHDTASTTTTTATNADNNIVMMPSDKDENEMLPLSLGCLTDRFDNEHNPVNNRLYPGQYICSKDDQQRYRFGLTLTADVVMEDMHTQSVTVIYENTHHPGKKNNKDTVMNASMTMTPAEMVASYHKENFHFYVTLQTDGSMILNQVHLVTENDGSKKKKVKALWTATPQQGVGEYLEGATIGLLEQCLPDHDCPHLHLHQGGTLVLNWVDDSRADSWQSKNAMHVYGL